MKIYKYPAPDEWENILKRPQIPSDDLDDIVNNILRDVRTNGDAAVKKYTKKFDGVDCETIQVTEDEFIASESLVSDDLKRAIKVASANIEMFHKSQKVPEKVIETISGVKCWQKSIGIEKVGLYIPGGSAPLFSTVLMLAIPAKIAGCKEIVLCSPPSKDGTLHPAILYAASVAGVNRMYKTGGVQAIGAMAYGTETIPAVYKIFGPGNQYVTAAKQLVNRTGTAIDMPAGPSEVMVVADTSVKPDFVASDLLAQAEHGPDSHVVLVTRHEEIIEPVLNCMESQLNKLPRKEIARQSVDKSVVVLVNSDEELIELVNLYGPEHLILSIENYTSFSLKVINAGSVFLGNYTPESAGDYASGTNHTLPTYGFAKAYNGVNLDSFVKKITYQEITRDGLKKLGPTIEIMAEEEQLMAHKNSVSIRLK